MIAVEIRSARSRTTAIAGAALLLAGVASAAEPLVSVAESGPVSASVSLSPPDPALGDPLILTLEVHAEPHVELLMPEFGDALDRFAIVDFSHSDRADEAGGTVAQQRYTLQPARSGSQIIPPLLVEFVDRRPGREAAPVGEDAYELLTEVLRFEVSSALPEGAPLEFRPALGELGPLQVPGRWRWAWLVAAGVLLVVGVPFAARAWLAMRARARRKSAYDVARSNLDALMMAPRPGEREMDGFFVTLSGIIRHYLEGRFGLRSPELTTEEFLEDTRNVEVLGAGDA